MSWKCCCRESNEDDEQLCRKCGRTRPKYMGVKLSMASTGRMSDDMRGVWYLLLCRQYILEAERDIGVLTELQPKQYDGSYNTAAVASEIERKTKAVATNCQRGLSLLDKTEKFAASAVLLDQDNISHSVSSLRSDAFFQLGQLTFARKDFESAIGHYQASFDADPNQVSIYNIAMATMNLPAEGGGFFGGKKKQAAEEAKREQEIDLLKRTVVFGPFSSIGIDAARTLMERYGFDEPPLD